MCSDTPRLAKKKTDSAGETLPQPSLTGSMEYEEHVKGHIGHKTAISSGDGGCHGNAAVLLLHLFHKGVTSCGSDGGEVA